VALTVVLPQERPLVLAIGVHRCLLRRDPGGLVGRVFKEGSPEAALWVP
jgi:hypothetical protein